MKNSKFKKIYCHVFEQHLASHDWTNLYDPKGDTFLSIVSKKTRNFERNSYLKVDLVDKMN